jgi:hypothetical protein
MRTTLNIDERLLEQALKETGENDRGRVINQALDELVRRRKIERLLASRGTFPDMVDRTEEWEEVEMDEEAARLKRWNADDNR